MRQFLNDKNVVLVGRGGGALWNSFACFHITALKWATEEKSFIDQMLALCSGFKIIIMKKLLGAPRGPHF